MMYALIYERMYWFDVVVWDWDYFQVSEVTTSN